MARTLNRVQLIGHLGADPELRYTTSGLAVATFSLATNRQWPAKDGTLQEETEWHSIVAWDKLAQICSEHLTKGRLVFIEGRIHTRSWESNGQKQYRTEIVATDMLILDSRQVADQIDIAAPGPSRPVRAESRPASAAAAAPANVHTRPATAVEDTDPEELPF
jgi:single-strand DNA-binding protein